MIRKLWSWGRTLLVGLCALAASWMVGAAIPASPVMTLYRFNGDLNLPYYDVEQFLDKGATAPVGSLTQGTTLIPCLVIRAGRPVADTSGTPYVGFDIVLNPRNATPEATARFFEAVARRQSLTVANHHCGPNVDHVIDVRNLYAMEKAPFFDPPRPIESASDATAQPTVDSGPDAIVRAFHNSAQCTGANIGLSGR
ncbi:MAG TPA: hypothetical protein VIV27_03770, partial [Halioglobus sp.]